MPRLLDLFCGAGGCSVGYARAGFDVVGVDIEPHPDYPFEFHQGDALEVLASEYARDFDVIHASPPCQGYGRLDGRRLNTRADGTEQRAARSLEEAQAAMGIDWMTWDDLTQAIPPAYTEWIGRELLFVLEAAS